jgi:hypothetical protein
VIGRWFTGGDLEGLELSFSIDLFAALEVATGKVTHRFSPTHTSADFLRFMKKVVRAYPGRELHVVLDNSSTHVARHGDRTAATTGARARHRATNQLADNLGARPGRRFPGATARIVQSTAASTTQRGLTSNLSLRWRPRT